MPLQNFYTMRHFPLNFSKSSSFSYTMYICLFCLMKVFHIVSINYQISIDKFHINLYYIYTYIHFVFSFWTFRVSCERSINTWKLSESFKIYFNKLYNVLDLYRGTLSKCFKLLNMMNVIVHRTGYLGFVPRFLFFLPIL